MSGPNESTDTGEPRSPGADHPGQEHPTPAKPAGPSTISRHELALYLSLRRRLLIATPLVGLVAVVAGWGLRGLPGLWGALVAAGVGIVFMATTVIVVGWTAKRSPQLLMAAMLGSWLVKMLLAFVVVLAIRHLSFYDRGVFLVTLIAVVLTALIVEAWSVLSAREAYTFNEQ